MTGECFNETYDFDNIQVEETETIMKGCNSKTPPGTDNLNMEMYKYASQKIKLRFDQFIILDTYNCIREQWRTAVVAPLFRKGNSPDCTNYRGVRPCNAHTKYMQRI
jgi:hypothetical protein